MSQKTGSKINTVLIYIYVVPRRGKFRHAKWRSYFGGAEVVDGSSCLMCVGFLWRGQWEFG